MRPKWVPVVVVVGVVLSALPVAASAQGADRSGGQPRVGTIAWGPCTGQTLINAGAECGMLSERLA